MVDFETFFSPTDLGLQKEAPTFASWKWFDWQVDRSSYTYFEALPKVLSALHRLHLLVSFWNYYIYILPPLRKLFAMVYSRQQMFSKKHTYIQHDNNNCIQLVLDISYVFIFFQYFTLEYTMLFFVTGRCFIQWCHFHLNKLLQGQGVVEGSL